MFFKCFEWLIIVVLGLLVVEMVPFAAAGVSLAAPLALDEMAYSGDDLGASYRPKATTFKLWAPTAKRVVLELFVGPTTSAVDETLMSIGSNGVWSVTIDRDLDGAYYLYSVTHAPGADGRPVVYHVNDPYARGSSANSGRSLVYDPRKTNPPGWESDRFVTLKQNVEAVIYEAHVRDLSINRSSGVAAERRGKYLGVVQSGTRNASQEKTGLDHFKELGITHLQLLPTFDYADGDETQSVDHYTWYNWGYAPLLYNTPEGSYASDPNGTARQLEFKQMVQELHRHQLGVVFDAVFNHTAATGTRQGSIFDQVVPGYFYRLESNGRYANGTGCGNELASEKPMARKFIVDSIKYWMTEYHVDGFRFDLMGIEDRETMLEVYREARKINPNAIIYGEGWKMEHVLPAEQMMTQAYVRGTGIAAFNDGLRDNIKGPAHTGETPGFVQGAGLESGPERFFAQVKGQSTAGGIPVDSPNETINYDSCHDDHCLWDKLLLSAPQVTQAVRASMDKLAAGVVLTSQGVPLIHAGDEFLRSKNRVKDSFESNDPLVNPIDWSLKTAHREVFDYYRGLIVLRAKHPAFRMGDRSVVDKSIRLVEGTPGRVVALVLQNNANGDPWGNILAVYNGTAEVREVSVPGKWEIVVNEQKAGIDPLETVNEVVRVGAFSMLVAHDLP